MAGLGVLCARGILVAFLIAILELSTGIARAQEPIKIGFSVSLTGGLASSGKAHLLSKQIWAEEINAKGGLLGRPVKLVYYDDQTNAATVPGIYAKLMDIDKVDLLMGAATNLIVAAMPQIMERKRMVMVLLALGSNAEFKYPRYFQSAPFGPDPKGVLSNAFFEVAKTLNPAPKTVALVGADAEFSNNVLIGARENAKKFGLQDRLRPQLSAVHRRLHADRARHPGDQSRYRAAGVLSAGFGRHGASCNRGWPQDAAVRRRDGRHAIRLADDATFREAQSGGELPFLRAEPEDELPRHRDFLKPSISRAPRTPASTRSASINRPSPMRRCRSWSRRSRRPGGLDDEKLAEYIHANAFNTIVGEIKFNELGEWANARLIEVQFQNVAGQRARPVYDRPQAGDRLSAGIRGR